MANGAIVPKLKVEWKKVGVEEREKEKKGEEGRGCG